MPFIAPVFAAIGAAASAVSGFVAGIAGSLGFGAAAAGAIGNAFVQFGVSFLINSAISAIFGKKPQAQDVSRELAQPTTAPAYRFVYGETRATGTPVGTPVKGVKIYGAWLLNSRPSDLSTFTLFFDKREVALTGDAFDLDGAGATATEGPFAGHVNVWVSRGDHTAPPTVFTSEAPYVEGTADHLWKETDAWKGRTMIWLKLDAGDSGTRQERWPATPPLVEVEGKWSLVFDPREAGQDPDDPATWEWSENHALCVRDALAQNPIRNYREAQIHASFNADGPDACDERINLNSGGTEARYTCAGTVVWSEGEIEDQLNPMMISGAADFIRIGGQLGYAAGVYRGPTHTLTYFLGDSFEFPDMMPGSGLINQLRVTYLNAVRGYETAELSPWAIPGALASDGGVPAVKTLDLPFCASPTQAMRVRKITGLRLRREERIEGGTLPPEAFDLVGGSTVTVSFPGAYDALNGIYEIEGIHPGMDPIGESGQVAMRLPASLVKLNPAIYVWDETTEEEEIFNEPYDGARKGTAEPGPISVTTGGAVNLNTGGTIIPRIRFAFDPSSSSVTGYEWEYRTNGGLGGLFDTYTTGGVIGQNVRDGSDQVFAFLTGTPGVLYNIRVRAIGPNGQSGWVEITGVTPVVDIAIDLPTEGVATGGVEEISVSFRTPNDPDFRALEIWASDADDSDAATLIDGPTFTGQNLIVGTTETGLDPDTTRYYFARSRGDYASASPFTASVSATTDA